MVNKKILATITGFLLIVLIFGTLIYTNHAQNLNQINPFKEVNSSHYNNGTSQNTSNLQGTQTANNVNNSAAAKTTNKTQAQTKKSQTSNDKPIILTATQAVQMAENYCPADEIHGAYYTVINGNPSYSVPLYQKGKQVGIFIIDATNDHWHIEQVQ